MNQTEGCVIWNEEGVSVKSRTDQVATAEQGILGSLSIDKGRLGGQKAENSDLLPVHFRRLAAGQEQELESKVSSSQF